MGVVIGVAVLLLIPVLVGGAILDKGRGKDPVVGFVSGRLAFAVIVAAVILMFKLVAMLLKYSCRNMVEMLL